MLARLRAAAAAEDRGTSGTPAIPPDGDRGRLPAARPGLTRHGGFAPATMRSRPAFQIPSNRSGHGHQGLPVSGRWHCRHPRVDKPQLLKELSHRAASTLELDADVIAGELLERESLGTTGVGGGVAIPHARIEGLKRSFGLPARLRRPIDFEAIDGNPHDVVFALLVPATPEGNSSTLSHWLPAGCAMQMSFASCVPRPTASQCFARWSLRANRSSNRADRILLAARERLAPRPKPSHCPCRDRGAGS